MPEDTFSYGVALLNHLDGNKELPNSNACWYRIPDKDAASVSFCVGDLYPRSRVYGASFYYLFRLYR